MFGSTPYRGDARRESSVKQFPAGAALAALGVVDVGDRLHHPGHRRGVVLEVDAVVVLAVVALEHRLAVAGQVVGDADAGRPVGLAVDLRVEHGAAAAHEVDADAGVDGQLRRWASRSPGRRARCCGWCPGGRSRSRRRSTGPSGSPRCCRSSRGPGCSRTGCARCCARSGRRTSGRGCRRPRRSATARRSPGCACGRRSRSSGAPPLYAVVGAVVVERLGSPAGRGCSSPTSPCTSTSANVLGLKMCRHCRPQIASGESWFSVCCWVDEAVDPARRPAPVWL